MNLIIKAVQFAEKAHTGQKRKCSGEPYIVHPIRVMNQVMLYKYLPDTSLYYSHETMAMGAVLHDVVEDCGITEYDLVMTFNSHVARIVLELTNPSQLLGLKEKGVNREARKKVDHEHIANISKEAKIIKMFDRMDNLNDMHGADKGWIKKYGKESLDLLEVVKDADAILAEQLARTIKKVTGQS